MRFHLQSTHKSLRSSLSGGSLYAELVGVEGAATLSVAIVEAKQFVITSGEMQIELCSRNVRRNDVFK
jgi:hypothetical protein